MKRRPDTICAISTPVGLSGIGIVRVSGPKALRVLSKVFLPAQGGDPSSFASHTAHHGRVLDGRRTVDDVLVTVLRAPRTYTGEDMAEIGCHGSPLVLRAVLGLFLRHGCRLAEAGEFTKRAFLNGRLDLAQAEAVPGVIHSKTDKALAASVSQLEGGLSAEISDLRQMVCALLAKTELSLDLSEETGEGPGISRAELGAGLRAAVSKTASLLRRAESGRLAGEGLCAAIVGRPNAGKSSLLNALLREERAIVTDVPGTTRDSIEESLDLDGLALRLIDTAGISGPDAPRGPVEAASLRRSLDWLSRADLVLLVVDGSRPLDADDRALFERAGAKPLIVVLNKADLARRLDVKELRRLSGRRPSVETSCLKGQGLERLLKAVSALAWKGKVRASEKTLLLSARQQGLLLSVARRLAAALKTARGRGALEFATLDLREASEELGRFLGRNLSEAALDDVFSYFCVGK